MSVPTHGGGIYVLERDPGQVHARCLAFRVLGGSQMLGVPRACEPEAPPIDRPGARAPRFCSAFHSSSVKVPFTELTRRFSLFSILRRQNV